MAVAIKVAGATFTKFVDVAFSQATGLFGFYEFQGATPTANRVGGDAAVAVGSPAYTATGVTVNNANGLNTGLVRPAGDFTWAALVRGIGALASTNGVLVVNEFDGNVAAGSGGNHLGYRANATAGLRGIVGYFSSATSANNPNTGSLVTVSTFDPTKHYLMAMTRSGLNVSTMLFDVGRTPTTGASTVASTETTTRTVRIGTHTGTTNAAFVGSAEVTAAMMWSRSLALGDMQSVYDYFSVKAPLLGITLA